MSDRQTPYAVIIGMEENGLGVARALAKKKIPCIGFSTPSWHAAWKTNTARIVRASAWNKEAVVSDLIALGQTLETKAPILITKDEPVLWISEAREELSQYFEINLPDDKTVTLLMDKHRFTELAMQRNWPIPLTFFINDREKLMSKLSEIVYPCILKPAVKNSIFRIHSPMKAFKLFNEDSLVATYDMVAQWEKEVVIQEWIEGEDNRVAYCLTYYSRDGDPLTLFAGRKLRQYPIEYGNTAMAAPAPESWAKAIVDLTQEIFNDVGYSGLGSVEFKIRVESEQPVIMEPTVGRTDSQNEIAVLNGNNIPAISYYDLAYGERLPVVRNLPPVKLVDGSAELRASWEYFRTGRLSLGQWLKDRSGRKKYVIFRFDDMGPFFATIFRLIGRIIRKIGKIPRRVIGRTSVRSGD